MSPLGKACLAVSLTCLCVFGASFMQAPVVHAHGEHNLEPFIRMRGISFFNVEFSHERLAVKRDHDRHRQVQSDELLAAHADHAGVGVAWRPGSGSETCRARTLGQ